MSLSGGERAPVAILVRSLGCHPQGVLRELGGDDRRAAGERERGRVVERGRSCRHPAPSARQAEVSRTGDGILDEPARAPWRQSPLARGRALVEHGGEQRMGEAHDAVSAGAITPAASAGSSA